MFDYLQLLRRPKTTPGGYLLIKRWGAGFWSDVDMVVTHLLAAELMKRTPVVHWGTEGPYANGKDETFELYFEPVSDASVEELSGDIYPHDWTIDTLLDELPFPHTGEIDPKYGRYHLCSEKRAIPKRDRRFNYMRRRREDVVVAYCWEYADRIFATTSRRGATLQDLRREMMRDRLVLRPELRAQIDAYHEANLADRPTMGVHLRGSDKITENPELFTQNELAFDLSRDWIDRDPANQIFLASDTDSYVTRWRDAFGEERIKLQDCLRNDGDTPNFLRDDADGYRMGCEVILDTYIAARCQRFVGNSTSNVAAYAAAIGGYGPDELVWVDKPDG